VRAFSHKWIQIGPHPDHPLPVKDVFSSVVSKYGLMSGSMSMGVHRLWKDAFVASLNPGSAKVGKVTRWIDVAGVTGDIALRILDHACERKADRDLTAT